MKLPAKAPAPATPTSGIDWLGHSSFRIRGSRTIYVDPWDVGPGPHDSADLILITHPHSDHCSPSDLARLPGSASAEIVTVADASRKLARPCHVLEPGERTVIQGVVIEAVPAYNINRPFHPKQNRWAGFRITMDGRTIYHAGDTDRIPEMAGFSCDVALLPVGGKYGMDAEEAAAAAADLSAGAVVPMHYGGFVGSDEAARRLASLSEVPVFILERKVGR